ncbi:hypothetical protein MPTK1_7g13380 [Marchantia polymorpha subsp. ruderalis]|nr:hypothetical protein MARPO_0009s0024 [Marchantia polymorpha]BBN17288.1 hypothetical protein Mp_7g13380 [Marchantia polymorpha subsp. ruderalis]|eukprot:PTQ46893.1 hypothetical protein MARPO_0009s0024 [Marchantia polymorpha]
MQDSASTTKAWSANPSVAMSSQASRTIFVGNIPAGVSNSEISKEFSKYGPIVNIKRKKSAKESRGQKPRIIEFEDASHAEAAVLGHDNYDFDGKGSFLRVYLTDDGSNVAAEDSSQGPCERKNKKAQKEKQRGWRRGRVMVQVQTT